jgi:hypothetical protein
MLQDARPERNPNLERLLPFVGENPNTVDAIAVSLKRYNTVDFIFVVIFFMSHVRGERQHLALAAQRQQQAAATRPRKYQASESRH